MATFPVALSLLPQWIVCTGWFRLPSSTTKWKSSKQNLPFILSFVPGFTHTSANGKNLRCCCKAFSKKNIYFIRLDSILHGHSTADDLRDLSAEKPRGHDLFTTPFPAPWPVCQSDLHQEHDVWLLLFSIFVLVQLSNFLRNRFLSSSQTDTDSLNAHQQKNDSQTFLRWQQMMIHWELRFYWSC